MTRILFLGDTAGTGFGTVTKDLGAALLAAGEDVRFLSINEQPSGELDEPFAGRTALMGEADGWLGLTNPETATRLERMCTGGLFADGWTPDALLILGDMGSLEISPVLRFIPDGFPAFHYVPIEGVGLPPSWAATWRRITPVAMCQFGADQIEALGLPRPPVVYHGVADGDFWPVSPERPIYLPTARGLQKLHSKADCKRFFGADPSRLWIFRADRHMPRKQYASAFRSVAPVLAAHPEVDFVFHCRTFDQGGNLLHEISKFGPLASRMLSTGFHDQYGGVDRKVLNALYNAADLYVSTSAEGFGLTIAESLMAGVPVVGIDYSSVPEVIGPAGVTVPVGTLIDNIYSYFWARPDEQAFTDAVEALVTDHARRRELGALGPDHVRRSFRWDTAAEQFGALFRAPLEIAA